MLSPGVHRYIFLFGLVSLAFGMMMGEVPTSVPQIILMSNWVAEGEFARKWKQLRYNSVFWALASLFLIHLVGLLYSNDFHSAFADLNIKMPMLAMSLVFLSSKPLNERETNTILIFFIAGSLVSMAWCLIYSFVLHPHGELRDASRFMSHIRLGLYLNMAIGICAHFALKQGRLYARLLMGALSLFFVFVLLALGLASGLVNLIILVFLAICAVIYSSGKWYKLIGITVVFVLGYIGINYVLRVKNLQLQTSNPAYNNLLRVNKQGRPLIHFDTLGQKENGNYVQINIQLEDTRKAWNKRVPSDTFSYAPQHNLGRYELLIRYLASRGYTKDQEGVMRLSDADISNIRDGVANYLYPQWGYLHKRLYEMVNEYDDFRHHREFNGHSLTMRLYFWQAALKVVAQHPLTGVGTGDNQEEMNKVYKDDFPLLKEQWYKRPHNQYLSILVSYGLPGLVVLLWALFYPAYHLRKFLPPLFWVFFITLCLSFLTEDTLETQAGLGFYAFFTNFFVAQAWFKKQQTPEDQWESH